MTNITSAATPVHTAQPRAVPLLRSTIRRHHGAGHRYGHRRDLVHNQFDPQRRQPHADRQDHRRGRQRPRRPRRVGGQHRYCRPSNVALSTTRHDDRQRNQQRDDRQPSRPLMRTPSPMLLRSVTARLMLTTAGSRSPRDSFKVGSARSRLGNYRVYYSATDTAGNVAYQNATLSVVDAPSVSSIGRTAEPHRRSTRRPRHSRTPSHLVIP